MPEDAGRYRWCLAGWVTLGSDSEGAASYPEGSPGDLANQRAAVGGIATLAGNNCAGWRPHPTDCGQVRPPARYSSDGSTAGNTPATYSAIQSYGDKVSELTRGLDNVASASGLRVV